jgi:hypothetical protein
MVGVWEVKMPRILKNTRIKWLPAKVQLRAQDGLSGSIPTRKCLVGENKISGSHYWFNDERTIYFRSYSNISMPSGLESTYISLFREDQTGSLVKNYELFSNITTTGVIRKGVGDLFPLPTKGTSFFKPYNDYGNQAVQGLSAKNPFYSTGSKIAEVGEGFTQPLWSKSKFQIDLTPAHSHSFYITNYTSASSNFPMAYWNKETHLWEGVGNGKEFVNYQVADALRIKGMCEQQCIGFGNGMNQGGSGISDYSVGAKVSNFGFPYHVKYHGSSSNTLLMSEYINEPFLLEKIVLEWSGSLLFNSTSYGSATNYTACTFFILNQKSPFGYNDEAIQSFVYRTADGHTHTMTTGVLIPSKYFGSEIRNTVRELVTYAQVVGFSSGVTDLTIQRASRELNIVNADPLATGNNGTWSGHLMMSATVKNALPNDGLDSIQLGQDDSGLAAFMLINKNSTRTGLFLIGGRDFVGALEKGEFLNSEDILQSSFPAQVEPTGSIITLSRYSKPNPYLLQPTDKLIFGWQLPIPNRLNAPFGVPQYDGKGTEMQFDAVPSKITFYGSFISEAKEYHESSDDNLSSIAIHEVIE